MFWPKQDPRTGLMLCESCWNQGSWTHHCLQPCDCSKCNVARVRKPKFTGEGQLPMPDEGGIEIGPRS